MRPSRVVFSCRGLENSSAATYSTNSGWRTRLVIGCPTSASASMPKWASQESLHQTMRYFAAVSPAARRDGALPAIQQREHFLPGTATLRDGLGERARGPLAEQTEMPNVVGKKTDESQGK